MFTFGFITLISRMKSSIFIPGVVCWSVWKADYRLRQHIVAHDASRRRIDERSILLLYMTQMSF